MDIKDLLKKLRLVDDKTAFARASGVSRATLYRILEGWHNPTLDTLIKLEKQLGKKEQK